MYERCVYGGVMCMGGVVYMVGTGGTECTVDLVCMGGRYIWWI